MSLAWQLLNWPLMSGKCPKCLSLQPEWSKFGSFVRESDKRIIFRFKCKNCGQGFSKATFQSCYRQKKRKVNPRILELYCSGVSKRRIAVLLKINRKTVARKLLFLTKVKKAFNQKKFEALDEITEIQFDDLETIEHTKCKPVSVTLAVDNKTRRILKFKVSQMPAKGHLAKISLKKYGYRADHRPQARKELFESLKGKVSEGALIESDDNPHYKEDVRNFFPKATYKTYLSERSSVAGQGELKKVIFDPLFSINHTFAMMRANINRLVRRTWCTTKNLDRLTDHIELYVYYHNEVLLKAA